MFEVFQIWLLDSTVHIVGQYLPLEELHMYANGQLVDKISFKSVDVKRLTTSLRLIHHSNQQERHIVPRSMSPRAH